MMDSLIPGVYHIRLRVLIIETYLHVLHRSNAVNSHAYQSKLLINKSDVFKSHHPLESRVHMLDLEKRFLSVSYVGS